MLIASARDIKLKGDVKLAELRWTKAKLRARLSDKREAVLLL